MHSMRTVGFLIMANAETGVDYRLPGGNIRWAEAIKPARLFRKGQYVDYQRKLSWYGWYMRYMRMIDRLKASDRGAAYRRSIAYAGRQFPGMSPELWARKVASGFAGWWSRAVRRPESPLSSHNAVTPDEGAQMWKCGLPSAIAVLGTVVFRDHKDNHPRVHALPRRRVKRLILAARAARRGSYYVWQRARGYATPLGPKVLAALGRLSPEFQLLALTGTGKCQHVRDLNWEAVAAAQKKVQKAKDPARARALLLPVPVEVVERYALRAKGVKPDPNYRNHYPISDRELVEWLTPQYPALSRESSLLIAAGRRTPVELSDGILASKEAHRWCIDGAYIEPTSWLQDYLCPDLIAETGTRLRDHRVVRWTAEVFKDDARYNALVRQRPLHGHPQAGAVFRFSDKLDELIPADLCPSVEETFQRAAERVGTAWMQTHVQDGRVLNSMPHGWSKLPRGVRALWSNAELIREGEQLKHCVGGYGHAVEGGTSVIVSMNTRHGRSTVEFSRLSGQIRQHRGRANGQAPHRHEQWSRAYANRIARGAV